MCPFVNVNVPLLRNIVPSTPPPPGTLEQSRTSERRVWPRSVGKRGGRDSSSLDRVEWVLWCKGNQIWAGESRRRPETHLTLWYIYKIRLLFQKGRRSPEERSLASSSQDQGLSASASRNHAAATEECATTIPPVCVPTIQHTWTNFYWCFLTY